MSNCLIVDDSSVVRKVARRILEGFEFHVEEASDGDEAVRYCQEEMPDFILLDWHLPTMDGIEFIGRLRAMGGGDAPKVLFCTSEIDVAQSSKARRAGADEYMLKPFDRSVVESKLHQIGML